MWLKHESFDDAVKEVWNKRVEGTRQYRLCRKLKLLKHPLKEINRAEYGHISIKVLDARNKYRNIMGKLVLDPNNQTLILESPCLADVDATQLIMEVEIQEVREALYSIGNNKSPGPMAIQQPSLRRNGTLLVKTCLELFLSSLEVENSSNNSTMPRWCLYPRGDQNSVQVLADALKHFSVVSGLHVNAHKSNIYLARQIKGNTQLLLNLVNFPQGRLPVKYLGLPLTSQRATERDFAPLVEIVDANIRRWNTKTLSLGGRCEFIKYRWVHAVYLQGRSVWTWIPKKGDSHLFKKLAKVRDKLVHNIGDAYDNVEETISNLWEEDEGNTAKLYDILRVHGVKQPWMKTIWQSYIPPRYSVTAWMALRKRLPTKVNLSFVDMDRKCSLCNEGEETIDHLFFECTISKAIWKNIRDWLHISPALSTIERSMKWVCRRHGQHGDVGKLWKLATLSTIHHIWKLRNSVYFDNQAVNKDATVCQIKVGVYKIVYRFFPDVMIAL
ncbi:unnamed protein product [Cuscuta campestris]|uniref:Reverse transcriptase zinc-binding domain-containing protein n=1 Tax=Cuscuta campestris TaxID=132261 RepID=A0A484MJQ1_9ASTE|nr:unnamed protein product [Cuscuta campestris]